MPDSTNEIKNPDNQIQKYYAVNHDSTAIFVTTVKDESSISPDVLKTFQRASVLFGAISKAIAESGKNLFDYDAYNTILGKSENFTATELEDKTFTHTDKSISLNLSIIGQIIGAAVAPEASIALEGVVSSIGSILNASAEKDKEVSKIAKAMLWIEEIMGVPDISIQLWYVERDSMKTVTHTNCSDTTSESVTFKYYTQEFTFLDPDWISKFSKDFEDNPEFESLVDKMKGYLTANNPQ
jgi:hypothetical protein